MIQENAQKAIHEDHQGRSTLPNKQQVQDLLAHLIQEPLQLHVVGLQLLGCLIHLHACTADSAPHCIEFQELVACMRSCDSNPPQAALLFLQSSGVAQAGSSSPCFCVQSA